MISVLENIDTKKKMLEACIAKLQAFTQDVKARIKNCMQEELISKNAMTVGTASMPLENKSVIKSLASTLDNAVREMRILKYLLKTYEEKHDKVGLGAVVVTHRNSFFVSADLQRFDMDGEKFIAISNQCPLFKSMRGKKRGDRFIHQDISYQILDIY